jgi:dipeptidyl aminopeptidase/acylaminoacyl peptidase
MIGGLNINDLTPLTYAPRCKTPALFIHAIHDEMVLKDNTERNFAAYGSSVKEVEYCDGGHNDERPKKVLEKVIAFYKAHLLE